MFEKVWKEFKFKALEEYLEATKAKASITKTFRTWHNIPQGKVRFHFYSEYVNELLTTIADELKDRVTEETTVLITSSAFFPILAFGQFEQPAVLEIEGPFFGGVINHSATVIVDPGCASTEMYAYNLNNPEKVLKLEIEH